MRVLYASTRAFVPDRVDGALNAAHGLLRLLSRRGHDCEAIASIGKYQPARMLTYRAARALSQRRLLAMPDRRNGYVTRRCWDTLVPEVVHARIREFAPDVLLTQLDGAEAIAQIGIDCGVPTVVWVHDNEFSFFNGQVPDSPLLLTLASSEFVARAVRRRTGFDAAVLYPVIDIERCLARHAKPEYVTFINPVWQKGVDVALDVARQLPHRKFLFAETWPLSSDKRSELDARLAGLPNVTLRPWSNEIGPVYACTKVLLAPSQWVEAFCMVIVEAHMNGIPAVVSRIGGMPATLGAGGILLRPDAPPAQWADAVEQLMSDEVAYERMSARALQNAARHEFNPEHLVERFLAIAAGHAKQRRMAATAVS